MCSILTFREKEKKGIFSSRDGASAHYFTVMRKILKRFARRELELCRAMSV